MRRAAIVVISAALGFVDARLRAFAPDFLHNLKISCHARIAAHAAQVRQRETGP
jgi:hypothetical protein